MMHVGQSNNKDNPTFLSANNFIAVGRDVENSEIQNVAQADDADDKSDEHNEESRSLSKSLEKAAEKVIGLLSGLEKKKAKQLKIKFDTILFGSRLDVDVNKPVAEVNAILTKYNAQMQDLLNEINQDIQENMSNPGEQIPAPIQTPIKAPTIVTENKTLSFDDLQIGMTRDEFVVKMKALEAGLKAKIEAISDEGRRSGILKQFQAVTSDSRRLVKSAADGSVFFSFFKYGVKEILTGAEGLTAYKQELMKFEREIKAVERPVDVVDLRKQLDTCISCLNVLDNKQALPDSGSTFERVFYGLIGVSKTNYKTDDVAIYKQNVSRKIEHKLRDLPKAIMAFDVEKADVLELDRLSRLLGRNANISRFDEYSAVLGDRSKKLESIKNRFDEKANEKRQRTLERLKDKKGGYALEATPELAAKYTFFLKYISKRSGQRFAEFQIVDTNLRKKTLVLLQGKKYFYKTEAELDKMIADGGFEVEDKTSKKSVLKTAPGPKNMPTIDNTIAATPDQGVDLSDVYGGADKLIEVKNAYNKLNEHLDTEAEYGVVAQIARLIAQKSGVTGAELERDISDGYLDNSDMIAKEFAIEDGDSENFKILKLAIAIKDRNRYQQYIGQGGKEAGYFGVLKNEWEEKIKAISPEDKEKFQPERYFIDDFETLKNDNEEIKKEAREKLVAELSVKLKTARDGSLEQYQELYKDNFEQVKIRRIKVAMLDLEVAILEELLNNGVDQKIGVAELDKLLQDIFAAWN